MVRHRDDFALSFHWMVSDLSHLMNLLHRYKGHLVSLGQERLGRNAVIYTMGFVSLPGCFHRMR